jgi:DNA polymerase III delta subunit
MALSQMLAKIDLYRGDKPDVNFKDVEDLLSDSFEKGVYDCVRAVFERNRDKAMREFARVLRFGVSDGVVELVYALSREAFTLLKYQLLKEKGLSRDFLGKELRLGSRAWLLNKEYPERARKWPKERLEKFLHRLADVDLAIRTTGRDAEAMLEQIVIGNLAPTSVEESHEIFV